MSNGENIEPLKEQLYAAQVIYSWESMGAGLKHENMVKWGLSIFAGASFLLFLWSVIEKLTVDSFAFWVLSGFLTLMVFASRYLFLPDKHRCYQLTSLGIHYIEKDMIPDVAYQVVRGFAWVGIVVCIIAVFVLGPLAFIGAGGFALMPFGMTNFRPNVNHSYILISERTVVFDLENDGVLSLEAAEQDVHAYGGNIFTTTLDQKQELLSTLRSLFPCIEFVKIKRLKDKYKHPVYQQEEEKAAE
ncbi:hypothetical protein BZJ19_08530 [Salinivibrio proteolyticus]|uniref:hypothetical protein n=1 Tax=Salinivibrio proteolyticus TaxID=334715 RepID=UPI0009899C0B|nr:hypothetical protein [Salinivibrio proteolyticus]OOF25668.1 hypothetical protein BZJ19_08530 [Salinivibrio proteolyticus]